MRYRNFRSNLPSCKPKTFYFIKSKSNKDEQSEIPQPSKGFDIGEWAIKAASKFGVLGTAFLSSIVFVFLYATPAQKAAIVDKYFLLKFTQQDGAFLVYILACIATTFIYTVKFYKDRLKIKDERIEHLERLLVETRKSKKG